MKANKSPTSRNHTPEFRDVFETTEKSHALSLKGMVVAISAIVVSGAVAAAGLYGVATNDYTVLKDIGESVATGIQELVKALK